MKQSIFEILSQEQMAYMLEMMYDLSVTTREVRDGVRFELICDGEKPIGFISYGPYADGVAKLHKLYLEQPALYKSDYNSTSFR